MKGGGVSGYAELDRKHLSIVIQYSPICAYRYAFLSIAGVGLNPTATI